MRVHIKKDNVKTFCGLSYSVFRCTKQQVESRKRYKQAKPYYKEELPTNNYTKSTCISCRNYFDLLVYIIVNTKNLHCFLDRVTHCINKKVNQREQKYNNNTAKNSV